MKKLLAALLVLALVVGLLAGCGGGTQPPSASPTNVHPVATPAPPPTPEPAPDPTPEPDVEKPDTGDMHVLVGTWAWDHGTAFTYVFAADGTGSRGATGMLETFEWATTADGGLTLTLDNPPAGFIPVEEWSYVIDGRLLTLTSRQVAGMEYIYVLDTPAADQTGSDFVGTWAWDGNSSWTYVFDANGTGTRGMPTGRDSFVWWTTADGGIAMDLGDWIELWSYELSGNDLTITSRQEAGVTFSYVRG
ncbi:MAG: hypothetical protein FWD84_00640 [Oscillospiraceae bacterium]|nr:hypothetical protein [Oscillospiraceae bacterium]